MSKLQSRLSAIAMRWAGPVGIAVRVIASAGPGVAGLAALAYGAWLAWPPAGWIAFGAVLLVDQAYERVKGGREG